MKLLLKNNLSLVHKITLAGLFIALVTICQKVLAINYISVIPFVRISFGGVALIMFSSYLLGPWFGLLIGAASDIIGYFIFDPKTFGFFPQITAIYALLGFASYFLFSFIRFLKNKKIMALVEYIFLFSATVGVSLFIGLNDELTLYSQTYQVTLATKIIVPICLVILSVVLVVFNFLIDNKSKKISSLPINIYQISFTCLISEVLIMVLFGTLMKGLAFGFQTYIVILIAQIIVSFINIPLSTIILMYIMYLTRKYIVNDV